MSLNKSDRNYIILILVVLISVLSMKVRPIKFRLVLKAVNLALLLVFLYKRDFKISLFLALLLFSLNQNGIGNSVDFFQNNSLDRPERPDAVTENKCYIRCYQDDTMTMDDCDTFCQNPCKSQCAYKLSEGSPIIECNEMCQDNSSTTTEGFQNNQEEEADVETPVESGIEETGPTTSQRQPLVSNEKGCRIKCLRGDNIINDCKLYCADKCLNTCTESTRDFDECRHMCRN